MSLLSVHWCVISWPEFAPAPLHVVTDDDDTELAPPLPQDGHRGSVELRLVRVLATWIQQRRHLHICYVDTSVLQFWQWDFRKTAIKTSFPILGEYNLFMHLKKKDPQI